MKRLMLAATAVLLLAGATDAQVLDARKIGNPHVVYVAPQTLKRYPLPVLEYQHDREKDERLKATIEETIIYPFLRKSSKPIAAIIVDFCPDIVDTVGEDKRGCEEDRGNLVIGVTVRWHNGANFQSLIERNSEGTFDKDAYLTLFPGAYKEQGDASPVIKSQPSARKGRLNN